MVDDIERQSHCKDVSRSQQCRQADNFSFLKLPAELRNQVYEYLLSTKHTKIASSHAEPFEYVSSL